MRRFHKLLPPWGLQLSRENRDSPSAVASCHHVAIWQRAVLVKAVFLGSRDANGRCWRETFDQPAALDVLGYAEDSQNPTRRR
jgi:hypothetical protein